MDESILLSIKKLLGLDANYEPFDLDIILHINSVFSILCQLGPFPVFRITGGSETWSDYLTLESNLEIIKTYIYMRVKQIFDPPTIGIVNESLNNLIKEYEWRINVIAETVEAV